MAAIVENTGNQVKNLKKGRRKNAHPHIDMTPMVDLGFLLLTFFVLTSTLSKPKAMEINMPVEGPQTRVSDKSTYTIILSSNNTVYWYQGQADFRNPEQLQRTDFSATGIRSVLLEKNGIAHSMITNLTAKIRKGEIDKDRYDSDKRKVMKRHSIMVIVKADDNAVYRNVVDMVDELQISDVGKYAIVDITDQEKEWIHTNYASR